MKDYRVRVGLRDPDSAKYVGSPEQWDRAESACIAAAESLGQCLSDPRRSPGACSLGESSKSLPGRYLPEWHPPS